jgi:predicted O-linked N-acetylglucosamine transferase (SPINDLY family)
MRFEHGRETPTRLRIGYVSPAFGDKPTAHLVAGMIEAHDRDRFEVVGYALGPDDGSDYARRVRAACDGGFVELRDAPTAEAARRINADGIHILADLRGYAQGYRPEVLALRPAPLSVSLVGYPGTMAAPFIDYFVADAIVAPASAAAQFTEVLVTMPGSYLPTDDRQEVAPPVARAECGLPDGAVVLACFNTNYKIEPMIFGAWMEILGVAPSAVLWLISSNPAAEANLRREAAVCGVDPKRLVFAERWAKPRHLARHAHADLFLDTHFVNAHTTAVDALTSGVPVLTWPGESFVARVGASLVSAAGLDELIAFDRDSYVAMAGALARDPTALRALKERLAENRAAAPLFDTRRYTRNLEHAYREMWRRHAAGLDPQPIEVPDAM